MLTSDSQKAPKSTKWSPNDPQKLPRSPQRLPKGSQKRPKRLPNRSKIAPERDLGAKLENAPKIYPKREAQGSPKASKIELKLIKICFENRFTFLFYF